VKKTNKETQDDCNQITDNTNHGTIINYALVLNLRKQMTFCGTTAVPVGSATKHQQAGIPETDLSAISCIAY